jgi:hypothetical protein
MLRVLLPFALLGPLAAASGDEVVQAGPWELHSSFWMSLHQTLLADAMSTPPRLRSELPAEELAAWNDAVSAYRTAGGRGDMTFAAPMVITTDGLTQVADDAVEPIIDAPLKDALMRAAPVYRRHWWVDDDRASRFFIAYAAGMLRDVGDALVKAHETVYRTPWPQRVRVYVTPAGGPFGAYTLTGKAGGVITTMSCRDAGYQGFRALEMLLHESSHAIVSPSRGTVGGAITAAAKQRGIEAPRDLWHAILFATSSELTRRLLVDRGVAGFVPSAEDLLTRAWPRYRDPIEKNWYPYLNGQGTLEEAIDKIVAAIPR